MSPGIEGGKRTDRVLPMHLFVLNFGIYPAGILAARRLADKTLNLRTAIFLSAVGFGIELVSIPSLLLKPPRKPVEKF